MAISERKPLDNTSGGVSWERIIYGRRYWFDATPYDVKAFRVHKKGGDLAHHWRDVPDVVGEYDRSDSSTRPKSGQIAWSRHWDHRVSELTYYTTCRDCGDVVEVTRAQLLSYHSDSYGARVCEGSNTTATLKAAMVRDAEFSPEEYAVRCQVNEWLWQCDGYVYTSDGYTEECFHPICGQRRSKGLRKTLTGWGKG